MESVVVADNASQKIVFDLGNDYGDASDIEESADALISSIILDEEPMAPQQIVTLDLGEELAEEPTLNTFSSTQVNSEVMKIESREREERLRNISMQLRTPSGLTSLEDIPAYQRNNIKISEPTHSSESEVSIYTLTNGNSNIIELKQNNSFLHDNVD
jgi:hypothetical protein